MRAGLATVAVAIALGLYFGYLALRLAYGGYMFWAVLSFLIWSGIVVLTWRAFTKQKSE